MADAILLMGHGSRDVEGAEEFASLVDAVRAEARGYRVEGGVLEFPGPVVSSIQDAIDRCAGAGATRVLAVPVLLHCAGHARGDMPAEVAAGRARYPHMDLFSSPPLGIHETLVEICEERIRALERSLAPATPTDAAVLLVGRGTTDSEANADFFKIGRLLWERNHHGLVECSFVSLAEPRVAVGIERCIRLGARRVLVVPYFLSTGVLVKRIADQAAEAGGRYPDVEIAVAQHLGVHAKLVGLILDRAGELGGGLRQTSEQMERTTLVQRYALPPAEIEARSLRLADEAMDGTVVWPDAERVIAQRIVYAAGDPGIAPLIRFHPRAVASGIAALGARCALVVDVRMVEVAINRRLLSRLGCPLHCAIDGLAPADGLLPRAALAMRAMAGQLDGAIVVVGNSPTALLAVLDLVDEGRAHPALIIGAPVGFTAAAQAKAELAAREVPFVTVTGTRGGSAVSAAATNALLALAVSQDAPPRPREYSSL
ncbi:MAG: hypothetical protein GEU73_15380 [Chloroflexi bacterium]|nr:hypothetical protein [Chloroflexota bacterium]